MPGYTEYLLAAYGVTTLVIVGNIIAALRRNRVTRQCLQVQPDRMTRGRARTDSVDGRQS